MEDVFPKEEDKNSRAELKKEDILLSKAGHNNWRAEDKEDSLISIMTI